MEQTTLSAEPATRVAVPFLLCTLIWSSTWFVIRTQLGIVPPAWSIAYRFLIAAVVMLALARMTGASLRLTARQQGFAAVYGTAQYALNYYAVYLAERSVTSGLVALLFALLLVPNALLGWIFLKQPVSRAFVMGSSLAGLGLVLLFSHELHSGAGATRTAILIGIGWSLVGVITSSIANVMQAAQVVRAVPGPTLIGWGMLWGVACDMIVAFALDGPPVIDPHPGYWVGTLYLGLIGSAVAFTAYLQVIRLIGPAKAAYTGVISPVLAMLLSTLFENYRWSLSAGAGCGLAVLGLIVALRARQAASPSLKSR